jgi:cell division protein FtsQ
MTPRTSTRTPPRGTATRGTPARGTAVRVTPARGTSLRGTPARGLTGTVSPTSAQRFAAKVHRRRRRRAAVVAAALTLGLACGWLMFASPVLAVQRVELHGLHRVPADQVRAVADREFGRAMALTSPQAVAERVVQVPLVLSARVEREWPSTLVIIVGEREPIAAVAASGGAVALVDGDGVVIESAPAAPPDLPLLDVDVRKAGAAALRAARSVSDAIPAQLRPTVRKITASSPDSVSFVLGDGSRVEWGSAQDGPTKATALLAIHPKPLKRPIRIDVSAPDAPAVTGRG